ncbi:MAG: aryl-sulfate sulfotransferase [Burkholderiaceae bacterium]|nr:aryl-sulfate sulfotransferase [Burkholderiaceae bacterium]
MLVATLLFFASCGGGDESQARTSDIASVGGRAGPTAFIHFVDLRGQSLRNVTAVRYSIEPKPGAVSRSVGITYSKSALSGRGYVAPDGDAATIPVFGLYAGHLNRVSLNFAFEDGSSQTLIADLVTPAYSDPSGVYGSPTFVKRRAAGSALGFDYFAIKSGLGSPVVVDTDGEVRWIAQGISSGVSAALDGNAFVIGSQTSRNFQRLEFDGSISQGTLAQTNYTNFHHNIDRGKRGLLAEPDALSNGVRNIEAIVAEFDAAGNILKEWDFSLLIERHMRNQGDSPELFVRPGIDWFHVNASTYDPRDDTIIASSRENFVIKVDYETGGIVWIFGDPSKYWYTFPSLRAKALTLEPGGLYPIGQHATSITSDGLLMLFNNGLQSLNQPVGAPAGGSRTYSTASAYAIDPTSRTAREAWRFDYGAAIRSDICSSVYEAGGQSLLISFATANQRTRARLVGLNAAREVVFDFEYPTTVCGTSWNALPVDFHDMQFR